MPTTTQVIISIGIVTVIGIILTASLYNVNSSQQLANFDKYLQWKHKFNKNKQDNMDIFRFQVWKHNLNIIDQHNNRAKAGLQSYYMALNQFSDLSQSEWIYLHLENKIINNKNTDKNNDVNSYACTGPQPSDKDLPDAIDWAAKSAVTAVKDQGTCSGAGYAFAAAQSIQSARYLFTGKLVQLSPQQFIDCTDSLGNQGCMAGNITSSFGYAYKNGVASLKKYPYYGFHYTCSYNLTQKQAQLMSCVKVTPQKQLAIKAAVRRQPLAASINAAKIQHYSKGVFDTSHLFLQNCKAQHNHWMLMVGYGRDPSEKKDYWKLKNSWGSSWGQQGYFYIVRKGDGEGQCGVQTDLYFPNAG